MSVIAGFALTATKYMIESVDKQSGGTRLVRAFPGFYLMDEPDAPLSFIASLGLVALLHDLARADSQVVVATHSPIVAAVPGAHILELGEWGMRPTGWTDLDLVASWRGFLEDPRLCLRYLLEE